MRNPLTFRIESWIGSIFVLAFSAFLVGIFFLAVRNFGLDADILASSNSKVRLKAISIEEKVLIDNWIVKNNPGISASEIGYRYLIKKYPDKPWTEK
ncbi:MAG: hypothetical protein HYT65_01940 [Candidatus Yanofskybacteria bacterium]|nr:hypothetical protein [Candidatus Yanofskybacteria bacterium]